MADIVAEIIGRMYPVGSIYMSVRNVDPGTLFGGTWTAWGSGRVPVGVNASDSNFNTVEKTGGSNTVTLTVNQIPSHNHTYEAKIPAYLTSGVGTGSQETFMVDSNTGTFETNVRGGGQAHNNLQPYITCYMWKRTA